MYDRLIVGNTTRLLDIFEAAQFVARPHRTAGEGLPVAMERTHFGSGQSLIPTAPASCRQVQKGAFFNPKFV
jgi:hypothetical protein